MALRCTRLAPRLCLGVSSVRYTPHITQLSTYRYNDQSNHGNKGRYGVLASAAFSGVIVAKAKEVDDDDEEEDDEEEEEEEEESEFAEEDEQLQDWADSISGLNKAMTQSLKVEAAREAKRARDYVPVVHRKITDEELAKCDELYMANMSWLLEEVFLDFLKVDPENDAVLWRLARVYYDLGREFVAGTRHDTFSKGLEYAERCIEINPENNHGHRWTALLGHVAARRNLTGRKDQLVHMEKAKYHLLKAIEHDPTDAIATHMLGDWYFMIQEQNWKQRLSAKYYYGQALPDSSYNEALKYFRRAEKLHEKPWKRTLLQLGKTWERLGYEEEAIGYLTRVAHCPVDTLEDHYIGREAKTLLYDLEYRRTYSKAWRLFLWLIDDALEYIVIPWKISVRPGYDGHRIRPGTGRENNEVCHDV